MEIKVLGSGCGKCRSTIERFALASGVEIEIVKVENPDENHRYGVHPTPAVVTRCTRVRVVRANFG